MNIHKLKISSFLSAIVQFILVLNGTALFAQIAGKTDAVYSGLSWYDQNGQVVTAHGANVIKDNGKYYLFGETHSDTSNAFAGFNCYSSEDLYNWKFESQALPVQKSGKLGPNRVGERVKVLKNPNNGEYYLYMHVDTLGYKDQFVGYATADRITGPYTFKGPLLFQGKPIKKWDMGVFQDIDGTGYILTHGGEIHKLDNDYSSVVAQISKPFTAGFESPTLFRKGNTYFFIGSHLTSWEKNDNYYYTSGSLEGPWIEQGLIAPEGELTWNSQSTYVLPIQGTKDTTFIFMGDRWSFPKQHSAATYVWQPLTITGDKLAMPVFLERWNIDLPTGIVSQKRITGQLIENTNPKIKYIGNWQHNMNMATATLSRSDDRNASFSISFTGTQIGLYTCSLPDNGYAYIKILDKKGCILLKSTIDMYAKVPADNLVFLSPLMPEAKYTLTVSVTGERPAWSDKRKSNYGSTANTITLDRLIIKSNHNL